MSGQSVANWTTNKSTLDSGSPFAVQDTAANLQAALSSLALDFHFSQIIVQDGPGAEIKLSVSQITGDATALAILKNPNGTTASVIASDTAVNIGSNFAAIATDSQVSSIQISNNLAVTLTALQVGSNLAAIAKLVNADTSAAAVIVKDTAANVITYLDRIETVAATASQIVVSNNSQLTLTAAQVASDAAALATVRFNNGTTTNLFKVSDTAANIGANLGALATNTKITAIAISNSAAVQTNAAQITAYAIALAKLANASGGGYTLNVTDNASNLSATLDALAGNSHVTQMVISDRASLTASVAQVTNDATLLAATTNLGGGAYRLNIIDTAINITGALQALGGNTHIGFIEVSGGTVMLSSVAALVTDETGLSKLVAGDGTTPASVIVTDTAANISAAIDWLNITPGILKLVVSDSASNPIVCTVHQLQLDSSVLGKMYEVDGSTAASVTVSDTGANLSFAALTTTASHAQVNRIVVTSGTVELSVAQWSADSAALVGLYNSDSTLASIWIADTASNIASVLSSLNAASQVARIVVTSGEVQVIASTASNLGLAKLYASNGVAALVSVSDSAAILSDQIDALNINARVNSIVVGSGGALTLDAVDVVTDTTALGEIAGGYTIAISDTAAQVVAYLDPLRVNGHVTSIALLDGGTPTITIGQASFLNNAATVGKIIGSFALDVSGVAVSQVSAVESAFNGLANDGSGSLTIAVSDTAVQLTTEELTTLGSDAAVQSISISTGTLALQRSQFDSNSAGLDRIIGNWSVVVSGVAVAQVSTVENDFAALNDSSGGTLAIGVNDGGIVLNDSAFSSLGGDANVHSIAVSDTNWIHLTETQFVADLAGIAKLTGIWNAVAFDATVTQVGALEADVAALPDAAGGTLRITVDDIVGNLTNAALETLGADIHVNGISITGGGTVTLTEGEFVSAATVEGFDKFETGATISVTGATVTQVNTVESTYSELGFFFDSSLSVAVVDTGVNLTSAALVTLGNDSDVQSIAVTGVVSLTEAQFVAAGDLLGLAKITDAWGVAVSGTSAAEVSAVESAFSALGNAGAGSLMIAVADAGANIDSSALAMLGGDNDVQSISVTGGILSLTEAQFNASADQLGLAKIANYIVELTQVAADDAAELADTAHVSVLQVADTASNIQGSLDALNGNNQVVSIVISDNAPLALTAYAATHDSRAIGLLQNLSGGSVSLTVSDAAADISLYFDQLNVETNVSSIVISDNAPLNLSAAQIADSGMIAKLGNADSSGVVVDLSDTATLISANLSSIESDIDNLGYVSQVTISDNAPIKVSLAQRASDQTALGLLQNENGDAVDLIVEDTARHILDNSASLAQDGAVRQVLIADDAALHLTAPQYQSDAGLFTKLANAANTPYVIDIADNAANISSALDALSHDAHVANIIVSGDGSLGIDVAQIGGDAAALTQTYNATDGDASTYTLIITDVAENIAADFEALADNTHVAAIVVSDSAQHEVTLSVDSALADVGAEAQLYEANTTTPAHVAVLDIANDISANFDALSNNAHVNAINVVDPVAVSLSAAQFSADSNAIGELLGSYQLSVSGVAANFNGAILGELQDNGHVGSITVSNSQEISVTVAQLGADSTILGLLHNANQSMGHVIVSDTAAQIQGAFTALNAYPFVNKVIVTDSVSNEVTISVAMTGANTTALGELYTSNGTTAGYVAVSDTASAISSGFGALNTDSSVNRIIVADSGSQQVILSAAAAGADLRAETELYQSDNATVALVAVADVASELSNHLDSLNANVHVGPITILDPGNALTLLAAEVADDARALGAISPSYTVAVTDTAANVAQNLDALEDNTSLASITVSDSGSIDVSVATFSRDQSAIASMTRGGDGSEALVTVADTTANVGASLVNLADFASEIASVALDDSRTLVISSVAALNADTPVIAKITSGYLLAISDSGGNITGAVLDTLETFATAGRFESLTVDGGAPIVITVAELAFDHDVLALTANGDDSAYRLAVADTAANVAANLDTLAQDSHVDAIALSDPTTVMTISDTQFTDDSALFADFTTGYRLNVTRVAAANAVAVLGDQHVTSITVSDSGADVDANLDALENDAALIGSVRLTDTSAPTLSVTYAELASDAALLGEVSVAFNLAVTNVGASQASGVAALVTGLNNPNAMLTTVSVVDSSTNVQSSFDTLIGLSASIVAVTFTDNSPRIVLSDTEYNSSSVLRSAFQGDYSLDVDCVVADATSVAADSHVSSIDVVGSSLDVQANFTNLNSISAKIAQLFFTDNSEPILTISGTQYTSSALLRGRFEGPYSLDVTDVAVSDVATINSDFHVTHLAIADSASNIETDQAALDLIAAKIDQVSFTDGSPSLSLTESQYNASTTLISRFVGRYALIVTGVAVADVATLSANSHVSQLAISDTSANVQTVVGALIALGSKISSVAFTDNSPALTLAGSQYDASAALRSSFSVNYALSVTEATGADVNTFASDNHVAHFSVIDTAAQVQSAFDALTALTGKVTSVSFTDVSPSLTVTEAQYRASAAVRALFPTAYTFAVTNVLVADITAIGADPHVTHLAILDSAANVQANLAELEALGSKITQVSFTDGLPAITFTEAQYDAATALRAAFQANDTLSVTGVAAVDAATIGADSHVAHLSVVDSSASVQTNYGALTALATKISSVAFTDLSPALTLTQAQYSASSTLRAAFPATYNLTVTGVAAAEAAGIAGDNHVTQFTISDTSSLVQRNFDGLNGLAAEIAHVSFTDGSPALSLTEAQYNASTALRGEFQASYLLNVAGVAVSDAAAIAADGHVARLTIHDSASNVQENLAALDTLAAEITQVSFTDSSPALTLTEARYDASTTLLGEIGGSYVLTITSVTATDASTIAANGHVSQLAISDTSANVQVSFSALNSISSKVASVAFTDLSPSLTLTQIQYNASTTLRAMFPALYALTVTGATAENATSLATDSHVSSVAIVDAAANIQSELGTLEGLGAKVVAITLSDLQRPMLTVTEAQYSADWPALQKIVSSFDLTITGVAAADVTGMISSVAADADVHTLAIGVSDTAAHISATLDALNASRVHAVSISDSGALVFSASAAANGASALDKLTNQNGAPISLVVSDTASQIGANFSSLIGITNLAAISLSDNGALSLTGAQVRDGAVALGKTTDGNGATPVVDVVDSAAGLEANGVLDALESNNDVASIVVSGGPLVVSVMQLVADGDVIAEMTNSSASLEPVTLVDSAVNIAASLGLLALDAQVIAIQLTSGGQITLNVLQLGAYQSAPVELQGATLIIKDTAAALQSALDQLQGLGALVSSVVVSNNLPMTISATQVANDANTLAKLSNRSGVGVIYNVVDNGANVTTALAALAAHDNHLGTITLTGGNVTVGGSSYQLYHATLDKIVGGFSLADAAPSVSLLFDTVNADAGVHAITLTNSGTPVLNLSSSSAIADTTAFAAITNPLFEILTPQGGTYYANAAGLNNAPLVVTDSGVHVIEKASINLEVVGNNEIITVAANGTLALSGNAIHASAGTGDAVTLYAGTGDQFTGSGDSLTIAGNVGLILSGSGNMVAINIGDTLTLAGPQTLSAAVSGAGALALSTGTIAIASGTTLAMASLTESGGTSVSAADDLFYGGSFTQSTGATLTEASGHTLTLTGTSRLSGAIAGAGSLALTGGSTTIGAGAQTTIAHWSIQGATTSATIGAPRAYGGAFSAGQGATITLSGGALTLIGGVASFAGATIAGSNNVSDYDTTTLSGLTVAGSSVFTNYAALTQSGGGATIGDSSLSTAKIVNQSAGVWNLADNSAIATAGVSVKLVNFGLLEKTAGSGTSTIAASLTSSGSMVINSGTLSLTGASNAITSSVSGSGALAIAGGTSWIGAATILSVATLSETGLGTALSIGTLTYAGSFTQTAGAIFYTTGGVFTSTGVANLGGTISGTGTFAMSGGTTTVTSATKLWSSTMSVQGSSTVLNLTGSNSRMSNFSVTGGATLDLSGGSLNLSGTSLTLSGARVTGSYTLANAGTLSVANLIIGGSAILSNTAGLTQSGGNVTLGDSSGSTSKVTNAASGTYDINDNSGVASVSASTRFNNAGLFEKTAGAGVSLVAPVFSNTGQIIVSSGTLEFSAGYTGAGADTISGASTLAFDSSVGSGATIAFNGSGGDLKPAAAHSFAGAMSGFDTIGSNDAITLLGTWNSTGFTENVGHTQGVLQMANGSQTASLAFNGNYASNFHVVANAGSTGVTYG